MMMMMMMMMMMILLFIDEGLVKSLRSRAKRILKIPETNEYFTTLEKYQRTMILYSTREKKEKTFEESINTIFVE
jgi:hypothetical protein